MSLLWAAPNLLQPFLLHAELSPGACFLAQLTGEALQPLIIRFLEGGCFEPLTSVRPGIRRPHRGAGLRTSPEVERPA